MRILLYAPAFYSLHTQIIEELQSMGHIVGFIPDKVYQFDPRFKNSPLRLFKGILNLFFNSRKDILKAHKDILSQPWDILFCINGYSFNKIIYNSIKQRNPSIKTILYLWDSLNFYDFTKNFKFFKKIVSFDPKDSESKNLLYKPLFYNWDGLTSKDIIPDIDLSFIGTQHTIRYKVLSTLKKQLNKTNLNYKFYLVVSPKKISLLEKFKYILLYFNNSPAAIGFKDEFLIRKRKISDDIVSFSPMTTGEVADIMNRSKCIVDIAKPDQNGFTNRMVESLGRNKKVITNVKSVKESIRNSNVVQFLDVSNPQIDINFLNKETGENDYEDYLDLRIDKWLSSILEEL